MKKCLEPSCGRLGDEIGQCGAPGLCPHRKGSKTPPADVDTSGRDVILSVGDLRRVVSVEQLISGRPLQVNGFGEVMDKSQVRAHVPSAKRGQSQDDAPKKPAKGTTPANTGAGNGNDGQ